MQRWSACITQARDDLSLTLLVLGLFRMPSEVVNHHSDGSDIDDDNCRRSVERAVQFNAGTDHSLMTFKRKEAVCRE